MFQEDHSVFLADFASDVVLFPGQPSERTVEKCGIFDADHETVEMGDYGEISTVHPVLDCPQSYVSDVVAGDELEIDGVRFRVIDVQPHDAGWVWLILHEV